ncbi:MAG TPA: NADH-quinone oxidoreductase subunit C [Symbiobacteriaceae bacterium]|jgi:Ni,Fe-hydrogenase III large subunit/Ni,Fe-hydrogenase III component G
MADPVMLLTAQFPDLGAPVAGPAPNETTFEVPVSDVRAVATWLHRELKAGLVQLVGVDETPLDGTMRLYYVFQVSGQLLILRVAVEHEFPSITREVPSAHWYEREIQDMLGLKPVDHPHPAPLVLHAGWPRHLHPLRKDFDVASWPEREAEAPFAFHGVEGGGVAEVPVGPIHAGIIEPGHFRFSTMGENVIRLEAQLFYTHRGLEKRAEGLSLEHGLFMAERVCGACALSHAVAYAQAVERLTGCAVPKRALALRTVALEMERLYNHIGDVGNLCAGAAFAFGNTQGMRLKEELMRLNDRVWGHRWLRGIVALGGVRRDLDGPLISDINRTLDKVEHEWQEIIEIILGDGIFMDRVRKTGILPNEVALGLGAVGVTARASGVDADLRRDLPYAAYGDLNFQVPVYEAGDVATRMQVRLVESFESFDMVRHLLTNLPSGPIVAKLPPVPAYGRAIGYVESPRGADLHFLMTGAAGDIYRYMVRSASYPNWAVVPYAVPGNLVADFPLINKSFELCYSCLDR